MESAETDTTSRLLVTLLLAAALKVLKDVASRTDRAASRNRAATTWNSAHAAAAFVSKRRLG